jgi:hypothetical protein
MHYTPTGAANARFFMPERFLNLKSSEEKSVLPGGLIAFALRER